MNNQVETQNTLLHKDVVAIENALSFEEKIERVITLSIGGSGDYIGIQTFSYSDTKKSEPPQCLVYQRFGDPPNDAIQQLPSMGFGGYDAGYAGYPINSGLSDYVVFREFTRVTITNLTAGGFTAIVYIIEDKSFKQRIAETL